MTLSSFEDTIRARSYLYAHTAEAVLHAGLAILLAIGAAAALVVATLALWSGLWSNAGSREALLVIDQLLLVLIFIEILHTVRISIRSESLLLEPFLIVGVIASVRRVLVITMQAARSIQNGQLDANAAVLFRNSMVELGLLGLLIFVLVLSIYLLRGRSPQTEEKLAA